MTAAANSAGPAPVATGAPAVRGSAALACAARGFRVFPLHAGAKTPAIEHWNAAATLDERRIRWWWRRWPDANLLTGLREATPRACGRFGSFVR
ncbi:bifunctional DNA primase/polymerase [Nocardia takedensis]